MTIIWKRGTTFRMVMEVESGELTGSETVRCVLKQYPGDSAPEALEFAVEFVEAESENPDRWYITASATDSLNLLPVTYWADVRVNQNGNDEITQSETFAINVVERVTEATA